MSMRLIFLYFSLLAGLSRCSNSTEKEQQSGIDTDLFNRPPFAAISDSIAADPKNAGLYLRRAELLTANTQYSMAAADLETAWKISPSENLGERRVNNLFLQGKSEEGIMLLKTLMSRYPDNHNLKRRMGEAFLQTGQYDKAIESYNNIIREDSLDFEAYYERATLFLERKDSAAAIADLEQSYRLQPTQLAALSLANIYAEKRNARALALTDLLIARDSAAEMIDPVFIRGIYYANTGNTANALEAFNQCIKMDWKFHEAYIEKGIIYFQQKNLDEAMKQFKLAATVSNTFADAYFWQGRCFEKLGKNEEAISNYLRAYALDREFTEAKDRAEKLSGR